MKQTYSGGCHCGKVAYEVSADLAEVLSCNCTICSKRGWLVAFVPTADFTLKSGEGGLTDYQFNKHVIHHLFCSNCGISSFARGQGPGGAQMIAVNVRCLSGVDPDALKVKQFDGRNL